MKTVETWYEECCNTPSDINEHMATLKKYAELSPHITEMGVRWVVSTFALIMGKPNKMFSIDIRHPDYFGANDRLECVKKYAAENNIDYKFVLENSLTCEIEETDLLFIDTLHTYEQLKAELSLHSGKVRKYIIFHDTTLFETKNEVINGMLAPQRKDGLMPAIEEFLADNPQWSILERFTNNNGLTIIGKTSNV